MTHLDVFPDPTSTRPRPYVLVNTFVPLPARFDEFLDRQVADAVALGGAAAGYGWRGNRVYRTHDGRAVIVVTVFDSAEEHRRWLASDEFHRHREEISPLLEDIRSVPCDLVAAHGAI